MKTASAVARQAAVRAGWPAEHVLWSLDLESLACKHCGATASIVEHALPWEDPQCLEFASSHASCTDSRMFGDADG